MTRTIPWSSHRLAAFDKPDSPKSGEYRETATYHPSMTTEISMPSPTETTRNPASRKVKVLALSIGQSAAAGMMLVTAMVLSRLLDKEGYATYRQTLLAFVFLMPFLSLGLDKSIYYFLPTSPRRPRGVVLDNLIVLLLSGAAFSLFLALGGNRFLAEQFDNPALRYTLLFMIPYALFQLPVSLLSSVLVVRERVKLLSLYIIISQLLIGLAIIVPTLTWPEAVTAVIGRVAMTVLTGAAAILLMIRYSGSGESWKPSLRGMAGSVRFGLPLGLATMTGMLSLKLDKFIVSAMCTPEEFAIYVNGAVELPIIGVITGSMASVLLADMRKMIVAGNNKQALELFGRAAQKGAMFLLPVACFLMVAATPFVQTLFSEKYTASATPFRIYLLLLPARIVYWSPLLYATGRTKGVLLRTTIHMGLNAGVSLVLIQYMGYLGAATGSVLATYLWSIPFNNYILSKEFKTNVIRHLPWRYSGMLLLRLAIPTSAVLLVQHVLTLAPLVLFGVDFAVFTAILVMTWPEFRIYLFKRLLRRKQ